MTQRRCYLCHRNPADEPSEWSGWGFVDGSPPKCSGCKEHVKRLREGEERKR